MKGPVRDFFAMSSPHHTVSPTRTLKWPGAIVFNSRATHWALTICNVSYAMWYEGTAQLLSLTESNHIHYNFILLAETNNRFNNWHSSGYLAGRLASKDQCLDWSAWCQHTVTDRQSNWSCLSRSVPEIHFACCCDIKQPSNERTGNNHGLNYSSNPELKIGIYSYLLKIDLYIFFLTEDRYIYILLYWR